MRLGVQFNGVADYRNVSKRSKRGKLKVAKTLNAEAANICRN